MIQFQSWPYDTMMKIVASPVDDVAVIFAAPALAASSTSMTASSPWIRVIDPGDGPNLSENCG